MNKYTIDKRKRDHPICKNGKPMVKNEMLATLRSMTDRNEYLKTKIDLLELKISNVFYMLSK